MAFNETTTLMNTTGREYYQGPSGARQAPLRSLTTAPGTTGPACQCKHGGRKLRARGSPRLRSVWAVALAALALPVTQALAADFERIHSFGFDDKFGINPHSEVIEGHQGESSDGWLYGTTYEGGKSPHSSGTVFKVKMDGSGYQVLHHFRDKDHLSDGVNPAAGLLQGSDGAFYGTTRLGGLTAAGTVFKLTKNDEAYEYELLHSFDLSTDGGWPVAGLIEDSDGWLYGTASVGGTGSAGTVFRLNKEGTFAVLWHLHGQGLSSEGGTPEAALVLGADDWLYGTTSGGGTAGYGTVFKLKKDGSQGEVLHHFRFGDPTDGGYPKAGLVLGSSGTLLYGTTEIGGTNGAGTVFELNTSSGGGYRILKHFAGPDGMWPSSRLVQCRIGEENLLYGTTVAGGPVTSHGTVFRLNPSASDPTTMYEVLTNFTGAPTNGSRPRVGLVLGSDGYLYGTTTGGGTADQGTVFKVDKTGSGPPGSGPYDCQLVWSFKSEGGDGADVHTPLVADRDGWLYGVTKGGGEYRSGAVFRMKWNEPSGNWDYDVLKSFTGTDGDQPSGALLIGRDGWLYGTTQRGGSTASGTVFRLNKSDVDPEFKTHQVLWHFRATDYANDGFYPYGALVEDCDGWLYGTTCYGGGGNNYGTVFKLKKDKDGTRYQVLKRFRCEGGEKPDGYQPIAGLVLDQDWLYGTTYYGGSGTCDTYSYGTVFKLNRHGANYGYETIYRFRATQRNEADPDPLAWQGAYPSELILDHTGEWLYGTTYRGGSYPGYGTVYRLKKDNPDSYDRDSCEVLWDFASDFAINGYPSYGMEPLAGLLQGADGFFYGTASVGGTHAGTIFKVRKVGGDIERQVVHHFWGNGDATGPGAPHAALVRGTNCIFYGTTALGGDMNWGTVYRFDPDPGSHPPLAVADTLVTKANAPLAIPTTALVANDSCCGAGWVVEAVSDGDQGGHASIGLGHIDYVPADGYVGWETFTYSLTVGSQSTIGRVNVLVRPTTVWVDDDFGPLFCGGHKWGVNAFADIQDGIDAVADGGFLAVASGTYSTFDVGEKRIKIVLGHSPGQVTINGNLTLSTNTTLEIELAGTTPGTGFDQLVVANIATLAGTVELKLIDGFYPARDATFNFLSAGTCSGSFDQFLYPSNDVGAVLSPTPTGVIAQVVNVRPEIPLLTDRIVDEGVLFSLMANATDADTPSQTLTYTLTNSPDGAAVSATGEITWTPTESQGPMTTNITICVTDDGTPNLTVWRTFQVVVNEINVTPSSLTLPPNQAFDEQTAFSANATATDADLPANAFEFALVSGPEGLTVSSGGAIAWTPTEPQGSNVYTVTICVTDSNPGAVNGEHLSMTNSFELTVNEVNRLPVMGTLADHRVDPGQTLSFTATATDPDEPANALAFSLLSPPAGAAIDAGSGLFTWRPGVALADTTNTIQVRVEDNGSPLLNDKNSFTVIVNAFSSPLVLTPVSFQTGAFTFSVAGPSGPDYIIQASTELTAWTSLFTNTPAAMPFSVTDTNAETFGCRFYRVLLWP